MDIAALTGSAARAEISKRQWEQNYISLSTYSRNLEQDREKLAEYCSFLEQKLADSEYKFAEDTSALVAYTHTLESNTPNESNRLEEANENISELKRALSVLRSRNACATKRLAAARNRIAELETCVAERRASVGRKNAARAATQLETANARIVELEECVSQSKVAAKQAQIRADRAASELAVARRDLGVKISEIEVAQKTRMLNQAAAAADEIRTAVRASVRVERARCKKLTRSYKTRCEALDGRVAQLTAERNQLHHQLKVVRGEKRSQLSHLRDTLTKEVARMRDRLECNVKKLQRELEERDAECRRAEADVAKHQSAAHASRDELLRLQHVATWVGAERHHSGRLSACTERLTCVLEEALELDGEVANELRTMLLAPLEEANAVLAEHRTHAQTVAEQEAARERRLAARNSVSNLRNYFQKVRAPEATLRRLRSMSKINGDLSAGGVGAASECGPPAEAHLGVIEHLRELRRVRTTSFDMGAEVVGGRQSDCPGADNTELPFWSPSDLASTSWNDDSVKAKAVAFMRKKQAHAAFKAAASKAQHRLEAAEVAPL